MKTHYMIDNCVKTFSTRDAANRYQQQYGFPGKIRKFVEASSGIRTTEEVATDTMQGLAELQNNVSCHIIHDGIDNVNEPKAHRVYRILRACLGVLREVSSEEAAA